MNWSLWLKENIQNKKIVLVDDRYDYYGDINWVYLDLIDFPIKFRNVYGDFSCSCNKITSLENAPEYVGGDFWCNCNKLQTMENCPNVNGSLWCQDNNLTSLQGLPAKINVDLYCYNNLLTSLQGLPEFIGRDLACYNQEREFSLDEITNICEVSNEIINTYL